MFDPHRIGPRSESFYSRNKGRILQRKLIDPPPEPVTSYDLDNYEKILRHNGRLPTFTKQDYLTFFPKVILNKQFAFDVGSSLTTIIRCTQIIHYKSDNTELNISLTSFTHVTDRLNLSIDGTHFYLFILITVPDSTNIIELNCNWLHQSEISAGGNFYYYLYDFGTTAPTSDQCKVGFFTTGGNIIFILRDTNFAVAAPSILYLPSPNFQFIFQ